MLRHRDDAGDDRRHDQRRFVDRMVVFVSLMNRLVEPGDRDHRDQGDQHGEDQRDRFGQPGRSGGEAVGARGHALDKSERVAADIADAADRHDGEEARDEMQQCRRNGGDGDIEDGDPR